jgi:hypothetical protein
MKERRKERKWYIYVHINGETVREKESKKE